ncbi:MAG TPA: hypothetical protein PK760_02255 [Flavobacteriales bacterium]|nr:hypothetical protein [Flavobacteriales bacterium]
MRRVITIVAACCVITSQAQDSVQTRHMQAAYVEFGGIAQAYSFNYEYRIGAFAARVGGGILNTTQSTTGSETVRVASAPIGILFISSEQGSAFELGIGYTPTWGDRSYNRNEGRRLPADIVSYSYDGIPNVQLGYRYQVRKGFLFRVDFTGLYFSEAHDKEGHDNSFLQPWGGLSLGYTF